MKTPDTKFDPYKPPFPASEADTSEKRQEWLAWHFASQEARDKQSSNFGVMAVISMGVALILPLLVAVIHDLSKRL